MKLVYRISYGLIERQLSYDLENVWCVHYYNVCSILGRKEYTEFNSHCESRSRQSVTDHVFSRYSFILNVLLL